MKTFHIGGTTPNSTHDCSEPIEHQTLENKLRSLSVQVRKLITTLDILRCSCQAGSESCEAYERVRILADGLGLTDRPLAVLFERKEEDNNA